MSLVTAETLRAYNLIGKVEVRLNGVAVDLSCCTASFIGDDGYVVLTDNPPKLNDARDAVIERTEHGKVEILLVSL